MAEDQGTDRKDAEDRALEPSEATPEGSASLDAAPSTEVARGASSAQASDDSVALAPGPTEGGAGPAAADAVEAKAEAKPEAAAAAKVAVPAEADPVPTAAAATTSTPKTAPVRRRASKLWWALPILMLVEFYVYGHNGRLEICVGKEGDTDFALVGQERTDQNRWKFPRCETRENLGLRSHYGERVQEGVEAACRGATIFRHQGESKACIAGEKGWQHRVEGHFVWPWDPSYYRHLFWFLQ